MAPYSPTRSNSRSKSRSRSVSRSQSRSRSRSRSRKRRYSSRSRSRSRSRTPMSYRNYPSRDYQNNRGYNNRGYNRGYRRPFHFRGRNRGYYPRGHYQNRGGGGYGYKSNWQGGGGGGGGGGGWHDRKRDQDNRSHSPRRGRSRSHTPNKRSPSRSHSRHSDRSSSEQSQRSRASSSSRSRSSTPCPRNKGKPSSKITKEKQVESQAEKPSGEGNVIEKASGGKWIDYDTGRGGSEAAQKEEAAAGDGTPKSAHATSYGGFGFFSKEDAKSGEKMVISAAFKKFLAENKSKKQAGEKEDGNDSEKGSTEREQEKGIKSGDIFSISVPFNDPKEDKTMPFFDEEEEEFLKSHGLKDRDGEEDGAGKSNPTPRDMYGKWGDEPTYSTSYPLPKEKSRKDEDAETLDKMVEEMYQSRKHSKKEEKAKKKEKKEKEKEKEKNKRSPSPAVTSKGKDKPLFPGAFPRDDSPARLASSREDFEQRIASLEDMPSSSISKNRLTARDLVNPKKDSEFRSIFQNIQSAQLRSSPAELFAQHIVSIVHYIKAQHFTSSDMTLSERFAMYQRKAAEVEMKPRKSPEIHRRIDVSPSAFKRHSHLFEDMDEDSSKKFKGDTMDLRLDIERRKRFAGKDYRREAGRSPGGSQERSSEKSGKHHKKSKKGKKKRDRSPSSSSSSSSPSPFPAAQPPFRKEYMGDGPDHFEEGFPHTRYPPRDYSGHPRDFEGQHMERGRGRGFFPRMRGRGWNRGNYPGNNNNNSNGNPANINPQGRPPEEEWDPEYTPKSRKYYLRPTRAQQEKLHDDRDGEKTWVDNRGRGRASFAPRRGRFMYRKGGSSPKWAHDMFQNAEQPEMGDDNIEAEVKDGKNTDEGLKS
ncbi:thyroid hormone receptor-associated protein 3b isoform X2 [Vanacampus margaritifer]